VNYAFGGISLEVVGETPVETSLLQQIWKRGQMERGDGDSIHWNGGHTGFYLRLEKTEKHDA